MRHWRAGLVLAVAVLSGWADAQPIFANGFEESCLADTDGDRLVNCQESLRNTDLNDPDTDDDGLSDGDETIGTVDGLNLAAFGVNPRHKDLLVEMDWDDDGRGCGNHSHRPSATAVAEARIFYAAAPIANPDGINGINFIADFGQGPAPFIGGNLIDFPNGVTGDVGGPQSLVFFAAKSPNFAPNRVGYFRFQAHAHHWRDNDTSSGLANIGGDNSVVSLNCAYDNPELVRNTIIHELGHNLGLFHGGNSICNGKPNYNSLMNYDNQFQGIDIDCDRTPDGIDNLGYSIGDRTFMQQGNLNEAQGVCPLSNPLHKPIDWNNNGVIDAGPVGYPGELFLNIECFGVNTSADHNDYAALQLKPTSPPNGGAPTPTQDSGACPPVPEED